MIELRVHHLYNFTRALLSRRYGEEYINDSYSLEQREVTVSLLQLADSEKVKIVLGLDDMCRACPNVDPNVGPGCEFSDSIWDAKKFMYTVQPNEIVTIGYLKKQFRFYQRLRKDLDWKKRIRESRTQISGGVN